MPLKPCFPLFTDADEEDVDIEHCRGNRSPLLLTAASDTSAGHALHVRDL